MARNTVIASALITQDCNTPTTATVEDLNYQSFYGPFCEKDKRPRTAQIQTIQSVDKIDLIKPKSALSRVPTD